MHPRLFLNALLRPIDRLLQLCIPVERRRMCYFGRPDYSDNAYFMYRHLLTTRESIEHVWLLLDMSLAPRIRREFESITRSRGITGHRLHIASKRSIRGYLMHLRSYCVFHTHGIYSISNAALRRHVVCLWHGMPIKCIGALNHITPNKNRTYGSVHLASSHFFRYVIASAFRVPPERVLLSGLPRCDALTHSQARSFDRRLICQRLGLPESRPLLLWMPTYRSERKEGPLRSFLDDLPQGMIEQLSLACEEFGCSLLIKLHPKDLLNTAQRSLDFAGVTLLRSQDWLAHDIQLYDLIAASDGLVSDVSSVMLDYLVTEKPIAVLGFNAATYTRDLIFPVDLLLRSKRIQHLDTVPRMKSFVEQVAARRPVHVDNSDIIHSFSEPHGRMSAEIIAEHLGL